MAKATVERTKVTPPVLAERFGVACEKVLGWIHSGELRAINVANPGCTRPRYLIDESDIADFEERRTVQPTPKPVPRRRRPQNVTAYF